MAKPSMVQIEEFFAQVRNGTITDKNFGQLIRSANRRLRSRIYPLDIDYDMSFTQRMEAGCYDVIAERSIKHWRFLINGKGKKRVRARLINMGRPVKKREVLARAKSRGLIRPSPEHLFAFGAQYPEVQLGLPIVGLFDEKECARDRDGEPLGLYLSGRGLRSLSICYVNAEFEEDECFLFLCA